MTFTAADAVELVDTRVRDLRPGEYATFLYELIELLKENADAAADNDGRADPDDE